MSVRCKLLSPLVKVFPDEEPVCTEIGKFEGFLNETVSFQLALTEETAFTNYLVKIIIDSPIKEYIRLRTVQFIPLLCSMRPADDNYIRTAPGLYPDRLEETKNGWIFIRGGQWCSAWIDIKPSVGLAAGVYPIKISVTADNRILAKCETSVEIFPAFLPAQTLRHTKWFHADCLAEYYHVETFSERHWEIIEEFIKTAVKRGINMILMPTFTLPLDTAIGGERLTTQLVDVTVTDGEYSFGFQKVQRWIDMCLNCGVEYFEIAHLFTQWGAKAAPKVMATVDGQYKRIFGWDMEALSEAYKRFLAAYLAAITEFLKEAGIKDKCYFHISDEPGIFGESDEQYKAIKAVVDPYLQGYKIIDALSDIEFYKSGAINMPVPDTYNVEDFLKVGMTEPWTYYCGAHNKDVSNQLVTMPSARNRILGVQLYKFGIEGFLHWGYNFYSSWHSLKPINPYTALDENGFGSSDAFQVYPGPDGKPEESIRLMVFAQALYDMRALQMLERLTNKALVIKIIEENLSEPVTFSVYPKTDEYLLNLRRKINAEIIKRL